MQSRRARWIAILAAFLVPFAGLSNAADPAINGATGAAAASRASPQDKDFPALTGRVVDGAGMLSPAARDALTRDLAAHESATGQQVVVVTVPTLGGRPIEDFGYQLGRRWGIGRAGEDDGALLIVAAAERQVRIEVGYGLEGTLTDAQSWDVIQSYMVPNFRAGDYAAGIVAGTGAVLAILRGDAPPPPPRAAERDRDASPGRGGLLFWIIVAFILLSAFGGRGGRGGRRSALPWIILGGLGGLSRGGGGGRGGFGGGGFSGGGGGFGGGGASGSW